MNEEMLFYTALAKAADERAEFLVEACPDPALRGRLTMLIEAHDEPDDFLATPVGFGQDLLPTLAEGDGQTPADGTPRGSDISLDFLTPAQEPDLLGRLAHYEVLEVLGFGGMGIVLKARDPQLNRLVSIKVLAREAAAQTNTRRRSLREARSAAAVKHEHLVTVYAVGEFRDFPYLVMEYVAGTSLEQRIKSGGPLETEQIVRIAVQIAAGLAAAHRNGLVHRDVKPANILLEQGTNLVKITDFGLARAVDDEGITQAGVVAGTPEYMAPEQAQGGAVDQRADLFSLGSVMYAMCTGRSPFRAEGSLARLRRVIDDAPQSIHEINPAIPSWLVEIVDRLHVKDPAERFQTAAEVADVLETRLTQLQAGELPTAKAVSVSRGLCWRRPLAWTAAICASLLLGLVVSETAGVTHLASTVIRVAAGEGTLVIEVDDPSIRVDIPGEEVVITGAGLHEIRLRPGEYRVRSTSEGKPIRDDLITISRGEQRVLAVRLETPAELFAADLSSEAATAPPPTATTAAELREANLRERIARNPDDSGSHYALAFILQNRGEYAEAEAEYRKVQQLAPDSMTTQVARVLVQQHKLDEAEAELRAYLGRHPENAGGHYYLGLLLSERKKYDEAESAFRRVLELQPGSAPILHQLALAVRNQGRRDEADEILHSIQNPAASQRPPDSENNPGWSIGN